MDEGPRFVAVHKTDGPDFNEERPELSVFFW